MFTSMRHGHGRQLLVVLAGLMGVLVLIRPAIASAPEGLQERPRVLLLYAESRLFPAILKADEVIRSRFASAGISQEF